MYMIMYVCVCNFATIYVRMCIAMLMWSIHFIEQLQKSTKQLSESAVLLQFYKDLQNGISLDELLPQLIAKRIITIDDKILIAQSGRSVNERCQYFLDQHISKPLSAGDSSAFYKFLLVIDASSKYSMLATKIKQSLMVESLQDKTFGM